MRQYHEFLQHILTCGSQKDERTGTGIISTFGYEMRFNLQEGFPLVTTKKLHIKSIFHELLWFLKGDTNVNYLHDKGITIWDEWADKNGELGPVYGKQWRAWECCDGRVVDQISDVIQEIKHNPNSRRLIVSAWNVGELAKMALPPCHLVFQFYVANGRLSCKLTQRSADAFLGVPFNIASYALLLHMVAAQCQLAVHELIWSGGDCHIYLNHLEQVKLLLSRKPYALPQLNITAHRNSIFDYEFDDFQIIDYQCHPAIKAAVAT